VPAGICWLWNTAVLNEIGQTPSFATVFDMLPKIGPHVPWSQFCVAIRRGSSPFDFGSHQNTPGEDQTVNYDAPHCAILSHLLSILPSDQNMLHCALLLNIPQPCSWLTRDTQFHTRTQQQVKLPNQSYGAWRGVVWYKYTRCVRKVMTLNAWLDNWQSSSHTSDTSRDIQS